MPSTNDIRLPTSYTEETERALQTNRDAETIFTDFFDRGTHLNQISSELRFDSNTLRLRRHTLPLEVVSSLKEIKQKFDNSTNLEFITLAGGAPRDLYMRFTEDRSKDVNDYDIFIKSRLVAIRSLLMGLGFTNIVRKDDEDYENDEDNPNQFNAIYDTEYNGLKVNIMVMEDNDATSQSIIDNFACSMSKFELDIETMEVTAHKEALLSIASETLIFKESVRENYKEKVCNYFSEYTVGSYQQAVFKLLDIQLGAMTKRITIG